MQYFPVIAFAQRYDRNSGIGTLVGIMPDSIVFITCWGAFLAIWLLPGIPIGPGVPLHYNAP